MRALKMAFIQRGLEGLDALPPAERAALLDGASQLMRRWAKPEAAAAHATAVAIREAETLQLSFAALLKEAVK